MTQAAAYRLNEYRIVVLENILIKWEKHVALGMERSGKCFIFGDILIIASRSQPDEDGFLVGEFHEQLQKLPAWNKTRYYCFASELLDNFTGQSVTDEFLEQNWSQSMNGERYAKDVSPGTFRHGQYQITVGAEREVSWQTYGDLNRIDGGRCLIESGVLCIGPAEYSKEGQDKQAFLDRLRRLPHWDRTVAWCRGQCLRLCEEPEQTGRGSVIPAPENKWKGPAREMTPIRARELRTEQRQDPPEQRRNQYQEAAAKRLKAGIDLFKGLRRRKRTGKGWLKYLIALAVAGLLLGLALMFHSFEKTFQRHDQHEKHHHEQHNDEHNDEHDEHR